MFKLKSEVQFDMAHYLSGYEGKCSNIHGHRYRLIVKIQGKELKQDKQQRGMLMDFGIFKKELKNIADSFDHKLVIENNDEGKLLAEKLKDLQAGFEICFVEYRPTAEEMARDIFYKLKDKLLPVVEVELYETPNNSAIYTEE